MGIAPRSIVVSGVAQAQPHVLNAAVRTVKGQAMEILEWSKGSETTLREEVWRPEENKTPAPIRGNFSMISDWYPRPDSNRQTLRRGILNPLRLPIPPLGQRLGDLAVPLIRVNGKRQVFHPVTHSFFRFTICWPRRCRNLAIWRFQSPVGTSFRAGPKCRG